MILDVLSTLERSGSVTYEHRKKADPFLWLADAVCGAVNEYLQQRDGKPFAVLQQSSVVGEITYLEPARAQKMRKSRFPS